MKQPAWQGRAEQAYFRIQTYEVCEHQLTIFLCVSRGDHLKQYRAAAWVDSGRAISSHNLLFPTFYAPTDKTAKRKLSTQVDAYVTRLKDNYTTISRINAQKNNPKSRISFDCCNTQALSIETASRIAGVSNTTLNKWTLHGRRMRATDGRSCCVTLLSHKIGTRRIIFSDDLRDFMNWFSQACRIPQGITTSGIFG